MNRRPLRIGITCYPTFGGSGVIATEIGHSLAKKGHKVHFISSDVPGRLAFEENVYFHEVESMEYPLFTHSFYTLSLASKMVEVINYENLDLLHVHYAIPHATSAYLAKQVVGEKGPKIITTLHGTDITLVGKKRVYLPVARFSVVKSDGVTAPSQYLKRATYDKLNVSSDLPIEVIPNFVDTAQFSPLPEGKMKIVKPIVCEEKAKLEGEERRLPVLVHVSNFRPVKRIDDVIKIFSLVNQEIPCHLVLIGDGPERARAESLVHELGLAEHVCFLGKLTDFAEIIRNSDVFLLPSETESFGLAALEALSCGIPVVSFNVGGLPEVIKEGETGFLSKVGDVQEMAKNVKLLLSNRDLYNKFSANARAMVEAKWSKEPIIGLYEDYYYKLLG